jgi:hypothetical protein
VDSRISTFTPDHLAARRDQYATAKGRPMSDRILFSMGGVSIIFAFMVLVMLWPV